MENYIPKWLVNALGGLLVIFVAMLIIQKGSELNATFKNQKPVNTISVSADGKITAAPDLATITLGVMSQGTSAADVKNQNNDKVNKVIAFIKQQGVSDADIKTQEISLYPQQNWNGSTPIITGYQGNQTITVKVRGVDKDQSVLNKIESGSVNNGANEVQGVDLTFENPNALQQQAQEQAIANAKEKAQGLAKAAGLTLGKVVSVAENNSGFPGPIPYAQDMALANPIASKSIAPSIQTGTQDITESMTVVFEVK